MRLKLSAVYAMECGGKRWQAKRDAAFPRFACEFLRCDTIQSGVALVGISSSELSINAAVVPSASNHIRFPRCKDNPGAIETVGGLRYGVRRQAKRDAAFPRIACEFLRCDTIQSGVELRLPPHSIFF